MEQPKKKRYDFDHKMMRIGKYNYPLVVEIDMSIDILYHYYYYTECMRDLKKKIKKQSYK